jgi:peptide/nickel transport system substrate-binding protein
MVHLMPATTVESFRNNDDFEVLGFDVLQRTFLQINVRLAPFDDPEFRNAFRQAVDQATIVERALAGIAQPSTEFYPVGMLSELPDTWTYDPAPLQEAMAELPSDQQSFTIGHVIGKPDDQRIAETMQTLFQELGIDVSVQSFTYAQLSDFAEAEDTSGQPAVFVNTANPDAAHPDTWIRIFLYTDGPANVMQYSNPAADALMDEGLRQTDPAASVEFYRQAGELIQQDAAVINLADLTDTFIVRRGVVNVTHQILPPYSVVLGQPLAFE